MGKNKTALFEIMDTVIELSAAECQNYQDLWTNLYTKAPETLKQQMAQASRNDFLQSFATLTLEIALKFDIPSLISKEKQDDSEKATFKVRGHDITLSAKECETIDSLYNAVCDQDPELAEKLGALPSGKLAHTFAKLVAEINTKLKVQPKLQ